MGRNKPSSDPDGHQSLRPMPTGSRMASRPRPWPSPHSREAEARAKAQILPELRRLQWMTLHPAPPGYRLEGQVLLLGTQLSPAGPGAPGVWGAWHLQTCSWSGEAAKAPDAATAFYWAGSRQPGASHHLRQDGTEAHFRAGRGCICQPFLPAPW